MKMLLFSATFAALALLPVYQVWAGDPEAGKTKSATCSPCHGENGIGTTLEYPNLAGQKENYLVKAIQAYRSGARNVGVMIPMVQNLTDEDIADIAAYFSGLSPTGETDTATTPSQ